MTPIRCPSRSSKPFSSLRPSLIFEKIPERASSGTAATETSRYLSSARRLDVLHSQHEQPATEKTLAGWRPQPIREMCLLSLAKAGCANIAFADGDQE